MLNAVTEARRDPGELGSARARPICTRSTGRCGGRSRGLWARDRAARRRPWTTTQLAGRSATDPGTSALVSTAASAARRGSRAARDGEAAVRTRRWRGFRATGDRWGMAQGARFARPCRGLARRVGPGPRAVDEALALLEELDAPEETADLLRRRADSLLHRGRHRGPAAGRTHARAAELRPTRPVCRTRWRPRRAGSAISARLARRHGRRARALRTSGPWKPCAAQLVQRRARPADPHRSAAARPAAERPASTEARDWLEQALARALTAPTLARPRRRGRGPGGAVAPAPRERAARAARAPARGAARARAWPGTPTSPGPPTRERPRGSVRGGVRTRRCDAGARR